MKQGKDAPSSKDSAQTQEDSKVTTGPTISAVQPAASTQPKNPYEIDVSAITDTTVLEMFRELVRGLNELAKDITERNDPLFLSYLTDHMKKLNKFGKDIPTIGKLNNNVVKNLLYVFYNRNASVFAESEVLADRGSKGTNKFIDISSQSTDGFYLQKKIGGIYVRLEVKSVTQEEASAVDKEILVAESQHKSRLAAEENEPTWHKTFIVIGNVDNYWPCVSKEEYERFINEPDELLAMAEHRIKRLQLGSILPKKMVTDADTIARLRTAYKSQQQVAASRPQISRQSSMSRSASGANAPKSPQILHPKAPAKPVKLGKAVKGVAPPLQSPPRGVMGSPTKAGFGTVSSPVTPGRRPVPPPPGGSTPTAGNLPLTPGSRPLPPPPPSPASVVASAPTAKPLAVHSAQSPLKAGIPAKKAPKRNVPDSAPMKRAQSSSLRLRSRDLSAGEPRREISPKTRRENEREQELKRLAEDLSTVKPAERLQRALLVTENITVICPHLERTYVLNREGNHFAARFKSEPKPANVIKRERVHWDLPGHVRALWRKNKKRMGNSPLHEAVLAQDIKQVKYYLNNRTMICPNAEGNTPLHLALMGGNDDIIKAIIEKMEYLQLSFNEQNSSKDTPLHLACRKGNFRMAGELIAKDARLDIENNQKETPKSVIEQSKNLDLLDLLENPSQSQVQSLKKK